MTVSYTNNTMTAVRQAGAAGTAGHAPVVGGPAPAPQFDVNQFLQGLLGAFGQGLGRDIRFGAQPQPQPQLPALPQPGAVAPPAAAPGPRVPGAPAAQQDQFLRFRLQQLQEELSRPFPQPGSVTLQRHVEGRGRGRNYKQTFGPGAHGRLAKGGSWLLREWSGVNVSPNTKLLAFRGRNFTGDTRVFGPGFHNFHRIGWADNDSPESGVVLPNVEFDGPIEAAADLLPRAASPAGGCIIDATNYQSHPAVRAFTSFIDRVISLMQGATPLVRKYESRKNQVLQAVTNNVIQNQAACRARPQQPQPRPQPPQQVPQQVQQQVQQQPPVACPTNRFFRGKCVPQSALPCPTGRFNAAVDRTGTPFFDEETGEYRIWCMRGPRREQIMTRIGRGMYMRQPAITPYRGGVGTRRILRRGAWRNRH